MVNLNSDIILKIENLKKFFKIRRGLLWRVAGHLRAVDNVSLEVKRGENLGLIGESGCGKSTLAKLIIHLLEKDAGRIMFDGKDLDKLSKAELRKLRRNFQIVFQDPSSSLDPRFRVRRIIDEAFISLGNLNKAEKLQRTKELVNLVHLQTDILDRFPHEFSGGERQRIAIARAIANGPKFLVLDEAVSSLDVLLQKQILNLLNELKNRLDMTYLVISHNLRVVKNISQRIAVMYLGEIVELASTKDIFEKPLHPYTQALFAASIDYKVKIKGEVPSASKHIAGCSFQKRCPHVKDICKNEKPLLKSQNNHWVGCHLY